MLSTTRKPAIEVSASTGPRTPNARPSTRLFISGLGHGAPVIVRASQARLAATQSMTAKKPIICRASSTSGCGPRATGSWLGPFDLDGTPGGPATPTGEEAEPSETGSWTADRPPAVVRCNLDGNERAVCQSQPVSADVTPH